MSSEKLRPRKMWNTSNIYNNFISFLPPLGIAESTEHWSLASNADWSLSRSRLKILNIWISGPTETEFDQNTIKVVKLFNIYIKNAKRKQLKSVIDKQKGSNKLIDC